MNPVERAGVEQRPLGDYRALRGRGFCAWVGTGGNMDGQNFSLNGKSSVLGIVLLGQIRKDLTYFDG